MRFITFSLTTALEQMPIELVALVALVAGLTDDGNEERASRR